MNGEFNEFNEKLRRLIGSELLELADARKNCERDVGGM